MIISLKPTDVSSSDNRENRLGSIDASPRKVGLGERERSRRELILGFVTTFAATFRDIIGHREGKT